MSVTLGLDIGSNSVGSAWIDLRSPSQLHCGISVFPAGVDETDDKRGEPKNVKRRMTRRTRITLARRAARKRLLRRRLLEAGLLPAAPEAFAKLLEQSDPWELRRRGLEESLAPFEFGRVLLHLAQRRGALGLKMSDADGDAPDAQADDDGKVKEAIKKIRKLMAERGAVTFGQFMAMIRAERVHALDVPATPSQADRTQPRVYRDSIRNKAGSYEHCADRGMIRQEFARLWDAQKSHASSPTAKLLTDALRMTLDDERGDKEWRHRGLLFGQRRTYWDAGTLGRCVLHPTERCVPHADRFASQFLVVETINNLKIIERGKEARPLTPEERQKIKAYLSGPLGEDTRSKKRKGQPKRTVSVTDLRLLMGWGPSTKTTPFRFNIENDPERVINTDWFSREIVHGAVTLEKWNAMPESVREGINRAILKFDPDHEEDAVKLRAGVMQWAGLDETQADRLIAAWRTRPKVDAKRLNMGRSAVRNLLVLMDREEPWLDEQSPVKYRWLTQIQARRTIAEDSDFMDVTTGKLLDDLDKRVRQRYLTGTKGATARDRHYMHKHVLLDQNGEPILDQDGHPLAEPPPAPMIGNPVVRKAIHEVRRHLVEFMTTFRRKPDHVYIELAREARMGKVEADRLLLINRVRSRIRSEIIDEFNLNSQSATQQRAAVTRVVLAAQQRERCPLCGKGGLTPPVAAQGNECDFAHILPRSRGGPNGLSNLVLAHRECNQRMGRRTPREYWDETRPGKFEEGFREVEGIYRDIERAKLKDTKSLTGDALWICYFTHRDDKAKIAQFTKNITDTAGMTDRDMAATKYAARQVMAYLADALYQGKGLPKRVGGNDSDGNERRIFATDGMWTSRLRREWGLFFDPHKFRSGEISDVLKQEREEKDRGDHRHHAIDAVVIALTTQRLRDAWEKRELDAAILGINTLDEGVMKQYRKDHPLPLPAPFRSREELRTAVQCAVFGPEATERPVCHRPVKRKLIGALHEETLLGPVLDSNNKLTENFTGKRKALRLPVNFSHLCTMTSQYSVSSSMR